MSSKIEKKDLKTIYRRYLALNCMNDYPGQMHNGYTFSLLPVLDKIYKDNKEERIKAKKRHMEYFYITPNIAGNRVSPIADSGPINAVSTAMEEENGRLLKVHLSFRQCGSLIGPSPRPHRFYQNK